MGKLVCWVFKHNTEVKISEDTGFITVAVSCRRRGDILHDIDYPLVHPRSEDKA